MKEITVTVDETGGVKVEAHGCAGGECSNLTAAIEKSIGRTTTDQKKPEFYQASENRQQAAAKQ